MEQYIISSAKHMWPFYILLLVVSELLLYAKQKKGVKLEIMISMVIIFLLVAHGQYELYKVQSTSNQYALRATVDFLSLLMPLSILIMANQFIVKVQNMVARHIYLAGLVPCPKSLGHNIRNLMYLQVRFQIPTEAC